MRLRAQARASTRLGERSREKIEAFVGQRVYLDLWVKTLTNWRRRESTLKYLGYPVPEGRADGRRS